MSKRAERHPEKRTASNKAMENKVTIGKFFRGHCKILKELFTTHPVETAWLLLISCITVGLDFANLRLLEYVTNAASEYLGGDAKGFLQFAVIVGLFLLLLLSFRLIHCFYQRVQTRYRSKIITRSEQKLTQKLSEIPYEYYESNQFHETINRAKSACGQYGDALRDVTGLVRIVVSLFVYGYLLARLSIWFAIVITFTVLFCSAIFTKVRDKQLDYWRIHVSPETRRNTYYRGVFGNRVQHAAIQTNRSYAYFAERYHYYNKRERKNYLKLNLFSFVTELASSLLFLATFAVTALVVGKGVAEGRFEIGYYSMVVAMLINLFNSVKSFIMFMLNGSRYILEMDAYYEVLSVSGKYASRDTAVDGSQPSIVLRGVYYRYPQAERDALCSVDATFRSGEKIALVGLNGSGKTTLISVILGLLERREGTFAQKNIVATAIMQDFGQYQMTVKENLEIGRGGKALSEEETIDILKKAGLYETIAVKPDGIYTKLGQLEEGIELSKGQWQRLAIGRLLANPEANVWILDEPTAYLDPIAEVEMYRFIFSLAGERLVFFISHRLGFAKQADRIVVVDRGKIIEDGTHESLMQERGVYSEMFEAQKEWYA